MACWKKITEMPTTSYHLMKFVTLKKLYRTIIKVILNGNLVGGDQ
jgi:hypothetical protein